MYVLLSKCCCCCPVITVQAMISRSSERVKQLALHRNPATDSSTDQCALIRLLFCIHWRLLQYTPYKLLYIYLCVCVFLRARELQVVQSKRDIEQPPLDQLPVRSTRTWTVHAGVGSGYH